MLNAAFSRELTMLEGLNRAGNIPKDSDFIPMNFSMDVGTASPSALYLNGFDARYMERAGGDYFPTRIIVKGEYTSDPKTDMRDIPTRYKDILKHMHSLSRRFPSIREGFTLYVDGSAIDTIELLKAYATELVHEDATLDFKWLDIQPQKDK